MNSDFWAITSYFNPCGYKRRLANFRAFRKDLKIPLIVVELSFGRAFELTPADADILIQLRDGDILWQKERLLNVGLQNLPGQCDFVAWLDCDVVFEAPDWPDRARRALRTFSLLQLFRECAQLAPNPGSPVSDVARITRLEEAAGWRIACGQPLSDDSLDPTAPLTRGYRIGFAWAASRELIQKHGFYDACILGGGDRAIISAAMDDLDRCIITQHLDPRRVEHYRSWAEPFSAQVGGKVGAIEGRLLHLWHGDLRDRKYRLRNLDLARLEFDPVSDIALGRDGAWRWSSSNFPLHRFVRDYFFSRSEDGPNDHLAIDSNFNPAAAK